ncbi:MAG: hypothetical protein ABIS06_14790 [Vicinamibacterales bacterium]
MSGWTVKVKSFAELRASLEQASEECLRQQTRAMIANAPVGSEIDLDQVERRNATYRREAKVVIDGASAEAQAHLARWTD